jgi:hypothetical protein
VIKGSNAIAPAVKFHSKRHRASIHRKRSIKPNLAA